MRDTPLYPTLERGRETSVQHDSFICVTSLSVSHNVDRYFQIRVGVCQLRVGVCAWACKIEREREKEGASEGGCERRRETKRREMRDKET